MYLTMLGIDFLVTIATYVSSLMLSLEEMLRFLKNVRPDFTNLVKTE